MRLKFCLVIALGVFFCFLFSGCGQSGPLYLPQDTPTANKNNKAEKTDASTESNKRRISILPQL